MVPAIYFLHRPCMALVLNLAPSTCVPASTAWSVLVGNVFNLIVAVQVVGFLSDWFGGAHGADAHSLRWAFAGARSRRGFWAELALLLPPRAPWCRRRPAPASYSSA